MKHVLSSLCLLGSVIHALAQCSVPASEFHLEGDYLIGGLFNIHQVNGTPIRNRPEAVDCSRSTDGATTKIFLKPIKSIVMLSRIWDDISHEFILSNYRRFQLMRFSVEQINNSTNLLPNVSLGYEVFDHCSDTQSFPGILKLISINNLIQPWNEPHQNLSKVIGVIGAYTSTESLTVAPLFMMHLIPMVSHGAASSAFSAKWNFPSFLRTVHPNQDVIEVVVHIVKHFDWRWVAFLYIDDDYGKDVLDLFVGKIKGTEICLAYSNSLNYVTDYSTLFRQIEEQSINVIIVFAVEQIAEAVIDSAIQLNVTDKVWIAGDAWSLNKRLPKEKGIKNIGTVIGISEQTIAIPGFSDFIYSLKAQNHCKNAEQKMFCDQICTCTAEEILAAEQSFSFTVYSAVYSIAHALHKALQCGADRCNGNITVSPTMVLAELKKINFTLLNKSIHFDENGDPGFGSYNVVFWNDSGDVQKIGSYDFPPSFRFFINSSKIQWYTKGEVPTSECSPECPEGHKRKQEGNHICCFSCSICPNGTYINSTEDRYNCISCKDTEWSAEGSTSCNLRKVEFIPFTDMGAILIMLGGGALVGLTLAVSVLLAINYNTPVVRSAGGPMCFLILGCLSLCSISVFSYFGEPSVSSCVLRFLPFLLFYTVCLACFVVRSFQIVCIFKIAAKFPKLHIWWMKYHGQWLIIIVAFVTQVFLLVIGYSTATPRPYNETVWYPQEIILSCDFNLTAAIGSVILLLLLCSLCFIFSYMGKDLPKNYNEAKAITFCLLLLILTWIIFTTEYMLYRGKYLQILNALAVLSSLYSFLLWYFFPKCYIMMFQPHKNTQQYFQGLIQNYTKTISQ